MAYIGRDIQYGTLDKQSFTANSSTTAFTLDSSVKDAKSLLVSVGGVIQEPEVAYTASGTALTFSEAPATGNAVYVVYLGKELTSAAARENITYQTGTGNNTTTPLTLSSAPPNASALMVMLNGVTQRPVTDYTVSGTTLTFTTAVATGVNILVYHLGKTAEIGVINDNAVTDAKIVSMDASKLTGSLPGSMAVDTTKIDQSIATLGLHIGVADNKVSYNLPTSFIDTFEDDSGILTETTVDRLPAGEYVSSVYTASTDTIPAAASDWTGDTGSFTFTSGEVVTTSGDDSIKSNWTAAGDFTVQFTMQGHNNLMFGVYATSEDGTFASNDRGGLQSMTNSFYWADGYADTQVGKGGGFEGSFTKPSDTSVMKITRESGVLKLYDDGALLHTWSGTYTGTVRFAIAHQGPPLEGHVKNLTLSVNAPSANATGTLISKASTADAAVSSTSGMMLYEDEEGTGTLGTDLKVYFSSNDGTNWTEAASYGTATTFIGTTKMVRLGKTTLANTGTAVKMKAEWANQAAATTGHTINRLNSAVHSTAQSKIGATSLDLTSNKGLSLPDHADWTPGASTDWTVEMWIYASTSPAWSAVLTQQGTGGRGWTIGLQAGDVQCAVDSSLGSIHVPYNNTTWFHLAYVRDGSTIRAYKDGVQSGSTAWSGTFPDVTDAGIFIGTANGGWTGEFDGYLDEIRISHTCRYPNGTTFTPSTTPYVRDAHTKLLIHSDSTNGSSDIVDSSGAPGKVQRLHGWAVNY